MLLLNAQGFTSQFDQFGFVKTLGDGASGQVILVQHKSTSERFAMKIIPTPSHTQQSKLQAAKLKLIKQEIALHQRCKNCSKIVRFKESFSFDNDSKQCIVMEQMKGGDL